MFRSQGNTTPKHYMYALRGFRILDQMAPPVATAALTTTRIAANTFLFMK
jgi:hypothetical protein